MSPLLLVSITSPFVVKDGVTAALNSLMNLMLEVYEEIDIFIVDEKAIYKRFKKDTKSKKMFSQKADIQFNEYSYVVLSPITTFMELRLEFPKEKKFVLITQLSDCVVYELWVSFLLSIKFEKLKLKSLIKLPFYFYNELLANKKSDIILLQTDRDVEIFNRIYSSNKGICLPNLVLNKKSPSTLNLYKKTNSIGWCATFEGDYLLLSKWFFEKVINPFFRKNKDVSLSLLGRENNAFSEYLKNKYPDFKDRIISNGFVKDVTQFYNSNEVVVCPVFKGYGLINKTVEAMHSFSIVLGDKTSFNGIAGVSHLENCIISNTESEFVSSLEYIFTELSSQKKSDIALKAHNLIKKQFTIQNNIEKFKKAIES